MCILFFSHEIAKCVQHLIDQFVVLAYPNTMKKKKPIIVKKLKYDVNLNKFVRRPMR